jgi:hypothetical protein
LLDRIAECILDVKHFDDHDEAGGQRREVVREGDLPKATK